MKKKIVSLLLVLTMVAAVVAGCGSAGETAEEEPSFADIAGTYTFEENALGGAFTVPWTLELKEDGTYVLTEENPFMGTMEHTGTYTWNGETVTTGAFEEGDTAQGDFFNEDFSCEWSIDKEAGTCIPVNYNGAEASGEEGGAPGEVGDLLTPAYSKVAYASTSPSQVCDIYLPLGEGSFPVIVLVHGGGFLFGDQGMDIIKPVIEQAQLNGYAVVSVDYRKSSEALFPAALSDVKAAVRFVRANAEQYGFDADNITIWGESAGAYLSAMTALTPEVESLNGDVQDNLEYSSEVSALVDFYGPIEFATMDSEYADLGKQGSTCTPESFESKFLGVTVGDNAETKATYWENYKDSVPQDLKVWIQVGDNDEKVPYTQSVNFAGRLGKVIGDDKVQFSIIEGAGHEDDAFYTEENLKAIFEYLK